MTTLVPSPVMHPLANSDQLRVLSHAPVTRLCHTPLSHTLGHPPPLEFLGLPTTLGTLGHPSPPQCSGLVPTPNGHLVIYPARDRIKYPPSVSIKPRLYFPHIVIISHC